MNDRSNRISKLLSSQKSRAAYILAKLGILVPAQIRALRLKSTNPPMPYQRDLALETEMHQSRISMFETPGMSNMTLETLSKVAAGLRSGVIVQFVPFSEMLHWENSFSLDTFDVRPRLEEDYEFINPPVESERNELVDIDFPKAVGQGDERKKDSAAKALQTEELNPDFSAMKKPSQGEYDPANEQLIGAGAGWN